jgi:molybdenum-dependent DNA-binding transcriptional regulator ModE
MQSRAVLTKYGTALVPLFSEIDSVVKNAAREDRNELSEEEIAHVLKISGRMVHELRKELEKDFKQE